MRRIILSTLVAATLGVPASALATKPNGVDTTQMRQVPNPAAMSRIGSIGGAMDAGNEPGHTTGPGNTAVDNSVRGPINDVQPGRGTTDTHQSANPKPVR